MESVLPEIRTALRPERNEAEFQEWDRVAARVEAYLRLWRMGDAGWVRERSQEILSAARLRVSADASASPMKAAMDEAEAFMHHCCQQFGTVASAQSVGEDEPNERLMLLVGAPAEANPGDRIQMAAAFRQGALNWRRALAPARLPETPAMTMQTSLSRLPSIRIIAGWLFLIALLFLAFILTHGRHLI